MTDIRLDPDTLRWCIEAIRETIADPMLADANGSLDAGQHARHEVLDDYHGDLRRLTNRMVDLADENEMRGLLEDLRSKQGPQQRHRWRSLPASPFTRLRFTTQARVERVAVDPDARLRAEVDRALAEIGVRPARLP